MNAARRATPPPRSTRPSALWSRLGQGVQHLVGADVHPGEWRLVLLFFSNLFLLLTSYYILKVIREPLILLAGGAVQRSYARGAQAAVLAAIIPTYSLLANRVEPARLVKWIMAFFVASLLSFYLLARAGAPIGFAFFVWLGVFSTLGVAQFWSLANDALDESEGRRLFPIVAAGGTLGGILGAQIAARAIGRLGPSPLILVAAVALAGCLALTRTIHDTDVRRRHAVVAATAPVTRDSRGAFMLVLRDRYLLLIAISVFILNLINTTGDFILAHMVSLRADAVTAGAADVARARQVFIGAFYGDFQTYVSVLTALVQIVLVARVWKRMGVGRSLFLLPVLAVAGYGASALLPGLALVATVKVLENSTDHSLQNTLQQVLFLPTSRDAKYKAKAAIDTVSVRLGDLASAVLVFAGVHLGLTMLNYALVNVLAGLVWLVLVVRLARGRQVARLSRGEARVQA
jgi:AAA family ATP:ADP antiporter